VCALLHPLPALSLENMNVVNAQFPDCSLKLEDLFEPNQTLQDSNSGQTKPNCTFFPDSRNFEKSFLTRGMNSIFTKICQIVLF